MRERWSRLTRLRNELKITYVVGTQPPSYGVTGETSPRSSIRGRLAMARAYLALSDVEGARTVLREARDFRARRPSIGVLAAELDEADETVRRARSSGLSGPTTLSAELRILALLPTHLTFREIGARLFESNNTVKSHTTSIYSKLRASSRSEAVERAAELGLLGR